MALNSALIIVAQAILIIGCSSVGSKSQAIVAGERSTPTIYVIQPENQSKSSISSNSWTRGKEKLVARHYDQATLNGATGSSMSSRSAKQLHFYSDEPVFSSFYQDGASTNDRSSSTSAIDEQDFSWSRSAETNNDQMGELIKTAPKATSTKGGQRRHRPRPQAGSTKSSSTKGGHPRRSGFQSPASKGHRQGQTEPSGIKRSAQKPQVGKRQFLSPMPSDVEEVARFPPKNITTRRSQAKRKNLVCYYGTWAVYRPDGGKYPVENIDPFLCTHVIYGFTGLSYDNLIKPLDPWNDLEDNYGKGAMKRFTNLKRTNPDLKTLVAIGGWNEGSIKYSKMASDPEARARFVKSVVDFLEKYNFDGLDLDWEYPGARGGASYDKQNFVRLLRELHEAFAPRNYLLTAAVSAGKWFIDPAYDIAQVSKYLDLINLMAYDYHGGWESKTGHNAPLFSSPQHDRAKDESLLNVNWSVNYWLQHGAPAEKIMLGVGSYGRSFTLDKANVNGINAPASQKGQAGPYTREPGSLGYNEICEAFQRQPGAWTIVRDPDYLAPYAYNDRQWVGYDDMESLALKTQYAKSMGLGGMMMWSIETDDFQGKCHNGQKYPLLNTIKRVMDGSDGGGSVSPRPRPTTTSTTKRPPVQVSSTRRPVKPTTPGLEVEDDPKPSSSTTTRRPFPQQTTARVPTSSSTTSRRPAVPSSSTRRPVAPPVATTPRPPPSSSSEFICRADGMFADPSNCRKFVRCVSSGGYQRFVMYKFDCGPGTAFNEAQQYCDHIYNVPSCANNQQAAANLNRQLQPQQSSSTSSHQNWSYIHHFQHQPPPPHHHQLQLLPHRPISWQYATHYVY